MADTKDERGSSPATSRQDRAARVAAMQKAERARARRRRVVLIAVPTVLVLGAGAGVAGVIAAQPDPPSLDAVRSFEYAAGAHTSEPVQYAENPPAGGEHDPVWLNCGVYDEPVRSENAVHSMEHGAVWITYRPDLPAEQVEQLREAVDGREYTVLSPYPDLPSPVVLSAWGKQLSVEDAGDRRVGAFLSEFVNGPQTPEPGALCSNGVGTPTG